MQDIIAGLDIGSTEIRAAVCEILPTGELDVISIGRARSRGICKGMIVDLEGAVSSVAEALSSAQREAGVEIDRVLAGISGAHLQAVDAGGIAVIKDGKIKGSDIDSAVDNAENMSLPAGRETLYSVPLGYRIDEQREIRDPVGMYAGHLEVMVHFITADINPYENFLSCVRRAGVGLEYCVPQPMAPVFAVLSDDEKQTGAVLVDMGGGTTNVAIVEDGKVCFSKVIPLGGESITSDISLCLQASNPVAEKIKTLYAEASADEASDRKISVPGIDKTVSVKYASEIIEARVEEIFEFVLKEIEKSGKNPVCGSGIVLTGGGALLKGIRPKAERFLNMPVRIGKPEHNLRGLEKFEVSPLYSSAVGLAGFGFLERKKQGADLFSGPGMLDGINRKMKTWFKDLM